MTPDPETIARMEARGWRWDGRRFKVESGSRGTRSGHLPLWAYVRRLEIGWIAIYGAATHDWTGDMTGHDTPDLAADEAEAWLRGVLSELRFPWLRVG